MKKLLALFALLAMTALPSLAQGPVTGPYLVDYFSNNVSNIQFDAPTTTIAAIVDQQLRLVNFGAAGSPLTSPVGDVCANIYVFDANQEMVACCSCRITPNGELTLSVALNLTSNPVTSVVPINGDIKVVSTAAGTGTCTPLTYNAGLLDSTVGFATHVQVPGGIGAAPVAGPIFATETRVPAAALSGQEQSFLTQACQFARYLGSGKGTCGCGAL